MNILLFCDRKYAGKEEINESKHYDWQIYYLQFFSKNMKKVQRYHKIQDENFIFLLYDRFIRKRKM